MVEFITHHTSSPPPLLPPLLFSPPPPSSFSLLPSSPPRHHSKVLDLTTTFRYANLPNNAKLEMVAADKPRVQGRFPQSCLVHPSPTRLQATLNFTVNCVCVPPLQPHKLLWHSSMKTVAGYRERFPLSPHSGM